MRAGQKLVANDGFEILLFPLEYLYMSQDEGGDYSHLYTDSIDFLGWGANGRVYHCPYYAPCTCKCVATFGSGRVFQSVNKVHTVDGYFGIITFACHHDNTPVSPSSHIYSQGDLIGHTGTAGGSQVTGDHLHLNVAQGTYQGYYDVGTGHYQLINSVHIYNTMYVNDTIIIQGYNHNWRTYSGGITPNYKKFKFKWVLYANKLRQRNVS